MLRLGSAGLIVLAACGTAESLAPDARPTAPDAPAPAAAALVAPDFSLGSFDTGNLTDACTQLAPWGDSWGIDAETFSAPDTHAISGARFLVYDRGDGNEAAYFFGKESEGRWGFVRFIEGDMWGGGNCGPIGWHRFAPVPTHGQNVQLRISLYRDTTELLTSSQSWIMFAINVWFSSPDMPKAGGDKLHRKPLVMDLAFHHECNIAGCRLRNYEDDSAYHYQALVGEAPNGSWADFDVDLSQHVAAAVSAFGLEAAEPTLALYQVEILVELRNAAGAASVDDYSVVTSPR